MDSRRSAPEGTGHQGPMAEQESASRRNVKANSFSQKHARRRQLPPAIDGVDVHQLKDMDLDIQRRVSYGVSSPAGGEAAALSSHDGMEFAVASNGEQPNMGSQLHRLADQRSEKSKISRNSRGSRNQMSLKEGIQMFKISSKSQMRNRGGGVSNKSRKTGGQPTASATSAGMNNDLGSTGKDNGGEPSPPRSPEEGVASPGGGLSHLSGSLEVPSATPDHDKRTKLVNQHGRPGQHQSRQNHGEQSTQEREAEADGTAFHDQSQLAAKQRTTRASKGEVKLSKRKDKSFQLHQQ